MSVASTKVRGRSIQPSTSAEVLHRSERALCAMNGPTRNVICRVARPSVRLPQFYLPAFCLGARAGHLPSADLADILRFDSFEFDQVGMTVVAEQAIEAIAQHYLVGLGLDHQPRGQVDSVTDKTDMSARKRSQRQQVKFAYRHADVYAA